MIQPADIKNQGFKKGLFGYKADEVNSFVNVVYRAYDELYKKNEELTNNIEKMDATLKESRVKIFELENKLQEAENVSSSDDGDITKAKKSADQIIKDAEAAAAQIIAKAKEQSEKLEKSTAAKVVDTEVKQEAKADSSASSKFFKKAADEKPVNASTGEDYEIFVGEIEDARKPDRMMIDAGEEEEDMDFEFL